MRVCGSTWWYWPQGSRLFLWKWPLVWRKEARDGCQEFNFGYSSPYLKFHLPPIKEERIQQLNEQKLTKLINEGHL